MSDSGLKVLEVMSEKRGISSVVPSYIEPRIPV